MLLIKLFALEHKLLGDPARQFTTLQVDMLRHLKDMPCHDEGVHNHYDKHGK